MLLQPRVASDTTAVKHQLKDNMFQSKGFLWNAPCSGLQVGLGKGGSRGWWIAGFMVSWLGSGVGLVEKPVSGGGVDQAGATGLSAPWAAVTPCLLITEGMQQHWGEFTEWFLFSQALVWSAVN